MAVDLRWEKRTFEELTLRHLYAIMAARAAVFVVEQRCAFQELDGLDAHSHHLTAWLDDGEIAAYLRVVPPGRKYHEPSLGRVMTSARARGMGVGKALMERGIAYANALYPDEKLRIGAQAYLEAFYCGFGFVKASPIYLEDEIEHIEMLRPRSERGRLNAPIPTD
jgi:ElaA protein